MSSYELTDNCDAVVLNKNNTVKYCGGKKYGDARSEFKLLEFESRLYDWLKTDNFEIFKKRISEQLQKLNISDWCYLRLDAPVSLSEYTVGTSILNQKGFYIKEAFWEYDFVLQYLRNNNMPVFRSSINACLDQISFETDQIKRNKLLYETIRHNGFLDIYDIPILAADGGKAMLSVASKDVSETQFQNIVSTNKNKLQSLARIIDKLGTLNFPVIFLDTKIKREQMLNSEPIKFLISMIRNDCQMKTAAAQRGISIHTAQKHVTKARRMLQVNTNEAAVIRLLELGLI